MNYEETEKTICHFNEYVKQTMDLLKDAYRWKVLAKHCDNHDMRMKYNQVSDTLMELFIAEHNRIGEMFKED